MKLRSVSLRVCVRFGSTCASVFYALLSSLLVARWKHLAVVTQLSFTVLLLPTNAAVVSFGSTS